jgi:hypothetical protein
MTKKNLDYDNCSSNSWCFYMMLFMIGTTEMVMSVILLVLPDLTDSKAAGYYTVNSYIFISGLLLEFFYWIFMRIHLAKLYLKTYGKLRTCSVKFLIIMFQSFVTIFPCDMLIFFGYEGN